MGKNHLTHLDKNGHAHMVDIGAKPDSERSASAYGEVKITPGTMEIIKNGYSKKGDVLTVAQLAGIMGAKKTSELIPLCHPLQLTHIVVNLTLKEELPGITIEATCKTRGQTGVEMEALTAVTIAALTVYDMVKAIDKHMRIQNIQLLEKHGGLSGDVVNTLES